MMVQTINKFLSVALALFITLPSRIVKIANAAEVSGHFILQIKQVPGYVMPDATNDPYHTKSFFCSSIELFLTNSLQKDANQKSKFSLLDIYKVEINNQVVGKANDNTTITAADAASILCPLYVNMTIYGEYKPEQRKKDLIDSDEYQQVLLQLFLDYKDELAGSLRDLVHIPYFSQVTTINAIASSALETQAKMVLDAMQDKQQKMKEKKLTAAITFMSIGGVGVLLLLIVSVKIISSRVRYNQVTIDEANNSEFEVQHRASSYSSSLGKVPPSHAFGSIKNPSDPFGYTLRSHHSNLSVPSSDRASISSPNHLGNAAESYSSRSNEFSISDGLTYSYNDPTKGHSKPSRDSLHSYDVPDQVDRATDASERGNTTKPSRTGQWYQERVDSTDNSVAQSTTTNDSNASSKRSGSSSASYSKLRGQNYDGIKRHCFAPPGKLGVAIENGPVGVGPVVHKIKKGSPLEGILKRGDRIVGIDDTDTRELSAADVTAWMVEKMECRRKITYMTLKQGIIV